MSYSGLQQLPQFQPSWSPSAGIEMPQPAPTFLQRYGMILTVVVGLIALGAVAYMVWTARDKAKRVNGPFASNIDQLRNPEEQADMREWQYLLQIAQRPAVATMIRELLLARTSTGSVPGGPPVSSAAMIADSTAPAPMMPSSAAPPPALPPAPTDRVIVTPDGRHVTIQD